VLGNFQLTFAMIFCVVRIAAAQVSPDRLLAEANAAYRSLQPNEAVALYRQYLALNPDRADVHTFLGGALLNLSQLQPAFEEANRAIALDGRYAKGYILAGRVCAAQRQWQRAQGFFEIAQHLDSSDSDRAEQAITAFERALQAGAEQSRVYENLGLAQDALGEFGKAETSFVRAVKLADGAWRPYLSYGAFLFRQGRPRESLQMLRQALTLAPTAEDARFELARVLYHENNLDEAAQVLQPARSSKQCRVHNLLARIYSSGGRNGLAEAEIKAIEGCQEMPELP